MQEALQKDIGFLLLTHTRPKQIERLVSRLNRLYNFPAIVLHHDFSQCDFSVEKLPGSISVVRPPIKTAWATFSIVQATLLAIQRMLERPDCPRWMVLLSGADYPIKPPDRVLHDLNDQDYDAHIKYTLVDLEVRDDPWAVGCCNRYLSYPIYFPSVSKRLKFKWRVRWFPQRLSTPFLPYSIQFRCYAGPHWMSINRRAAEYIVQAAAVNQRLATHLEPTFCPEETFFQTLLVNAPSLRVHDHNYRYYDWSAGGAHPKTLTMEDLPRLLKSPRHFARKFDADNVELLDAVDAAVDAMERI